MIRLWFCSCSLSAHSISFSGKPCFTSLRELQSPSLRRCLVIHAWTIFFHFPLHLLLLFHFPFPFPLPLHFPFTAFIFSFTSSSPYPSSPLFSSPLSSNRRRLVIRSCLNNSSFTSLHFHLPLHFPFTAFIFSFTSSLTSSPLFSPPSFLLPLFSPLLFSPPFFFPSHPVSPGQVQRKNTVTYVA